MHRKPPSWNRSLLFLLLPLVLAIVLAAVLWPGSSHGQLDKLGATSAHLPSQAVDRTWLPADGLRRTVAADLAHSARHHQAVLERRKDRERALQRQQRAQAASLGTTTAPSYSYNGPTGTQAERAVAFVYAQLGCPYVYGGTGPCSAGFDCSGLVMQAWASAGVSIPRTSEEQWASLTPVPVSQLRPGDLLIFDGGGHVGMYVGGGMLIDAPQPGEVVEKVAFSGWYQANFVGAVRP